MRTKQLLTKTLLVAAGLLVGATSAWADTDCTASVSATGWLKSGGTAAGATNTDFAPAVTAGQMYEIYETTTATTGILLYQNISGLTNGVYQVELYANAMYTSGRGFDGDADAARVYLFANGQTVQVNTAEATSTAANGEYTLRNVVVTDGTLKLGLIKNVAGTNWHNIQIKSLTLLADATTTWESCVSSATALSPVDVNFFIQNCDFEVDGAADGTKDAATGWAQCSTVTNYRPHPLSNFTNTSGAFTGGYAFENWRDGGLAGQISQSISNIPNGKYKLNLSAFASTANGQFIYGKSNGVTYKTNLTQSNSTEDCNVDVIVSDNTLEIGFDMNDAGVNWAAVDNARLRYYGTTLINDAVAFVNGASMTADQWYYFDATVAGTYEFAAGSNISTISFTNDGTQVTSSATGTTLTASQSFTATRYYFKSTSAQTLTVDVPTGARIVNAEIDFSTPLAGTTAAGAVSSMTIGSTDRVLINSDGRLFFGNGGGTVNLVGGEAGTRDAVTISFSFAWGKLSGKEAGFKIRGKNSGDEVVDIAAFSANAYNGTISKSDFGIVWDDMNRAESTAEWSKKTDITITVDFSAKTITTTTACSAATNTSNSYVKPLPDGIESVTQFVLTSNYNQTSGKTIVNDRNCLFDDLLIYTTKGDYSISNVGYTLKFVDDNGTTVKADDTSREAVPGTSISNLASSSDQTTFYNDGDIANNNTVEFALATNKYVYKSVNAVNSSDEEIDELEDGAIVTIVYDKYTKYDYAIKQKLGDAAATDLQTGTKWTDESFSYSYPVCVKDASNDYYVTTARGESPHFGITISKDNTTPTISYTLDDDIVYYAEAEDMAGSRYGEGQLANYSSKGASYCSAASEGSYIATSWSLSAGNYDIEVGIGSRKSSATVTPTLKKAEADDIALASITRGEGAYDTKEYYNVNIPSGYQLYFGNNNSNNASTWALDYVIVRNAPTTVSATITAAGAATLVSPYALNFTGIESVKAYYASAQDGANITFTRINGTVAANTPLYITGTTTSVPVVATGDAVAGTNLLVAGTGAAVASEAGGKYNFILNKVGKDVGFYKAAGQTVATDKAYLSLSSNPFPPTSDAKSLNLIFDGETTGISDITRLNGNGESMNDMPIFNLSGQKLATPQKGINIINGRKVVVK